MAKRLGIDAELENWRHAKRWRNSSAATSARLSFVMEVATD
jgi:hypothetical protein